MTESSHECTCGRTLRYRQDMERRPGGVDGTWVCRDCGTPVPGMVAQKLRHQDPS